MSSCWNIDIARDDKLTGEEMASDDANGKCVVMADTCREERE